MAAEIVGTAYVRIRAITAGLAKDISDGVDKGVKDADVDKAGKALGGGLADSSTKEFGGSMADGIGETLDSPDVHKAAEKGGEGVGKDVSKGIDKEHKKNNPFAALGDRLKAIDLSGAVMPQLQKISKDFDGAFKEWDLDVDVPGMERKAEDAGRRVGDATTKGVEDSHKKKNPFKKFTEGLDKLSASKLVNWTAIFGPTTLAPIIGTVTAGIGLIVQALGFVVLAAAGAGVAIAGIAAVALPGLGLLFAAFKTETEQLKKFKEGAKKLLAPWRALGIQTQKFLLPGITSLLEAVGELIPLFTEGVGGADSFATTIGKTFGGMAEWVGLILKGSRAQEALGVILGESEEFFKDIAAVALTFIDMFLPFLAAAAPLATQFSESLKGWAAGLHESFAKMEGETLTDKFQGWYNKLALLVGIVGDVLVGLWNVLSVAGETSTPFFDKIAEAAQKFRDWSASAEGQNRIKKFFEDIQPVIDGVFDVLGDLFDLIVAPTVEGGGTTMFENLAGALQILHEVLSSPIAEKVAPYILTLATSLAILNAVPGLSTGLLARGIVGVAKGLGELVLSMAGVKGLTGPMATLGAALAPFAGVLLLVAAAILAVIAVWYWWDEVNAALSAAWEWFTKLEMPMKIFVGTLAVLAFLFSAVVAGIVLFAAAVYGIVWAIKNWDKVVEAFTKAKDAVWNFLQNIFDLEKLPDRLRAIGDAILEVFKDLPDTLRNVGEKIGAFIGSLPEQLGPIAQRIIEAITPTVDKIKAALAPIATALLDFVRELPQNLAALGDQLGEFFGGLGGRIKDALLAAIGNLPSLLLTAWGGMWNLGENVLGLLTSGMQAVLPKLVEFVVSIPGFIIRAVQAVLPTMLSVGIKIIGFILSGLAQALPKILFWFLRLPFEIGTILRKALVGLVKLGAAMVVSLIKGIFEERGRIFDWFKDLPGNLLSMVKTGMSFMFSIGKDLLVAIYNGIVNNAGAVWDWFTKMPGIILGLLGQAASMLWDVGGKLLTGMLDGVKALWGSVNEYFMGIPGMLVSAITGAWGVIGEMAGKIPGLILDGIMLYINLLWDFWTTVPQLIVDTLTTVADKLTDLGGTILGWIVDGLTAAWHFVTDWIGGLPQKFLDGLTVIIDGIKNLGGTVLGWIVDGLTAGWNLVTDWIGGLPQKFLDGLWVIYDGIKELGGTLIGWVVNGLAFAFETGGAIFEWIKDFPGNLWDGLFILKDEFLDIGGDMISWVIEGIGDIGAMLLELLKGAWNWAVDQLPEFSGPFGIHVSADFLKIDLAEGGVFPGRPGGYNATIGEAGAEAVIPLTRPSRALQLLQQSGLDKLVLNSYAGGSGTPGTVGDTTMVHIDTAIMQTPVDVDMVAQRVTAAYNRIAS